VLDELLEYHQTPGSDSFVADVMKSIQRQQKLKKLILLSSGLIGAVFGIVGAMFLSESINRLTTQLAAAESATSLGLAIMSLVAFLGWLLHDETRMRV
jgi:flagellar motor component MotA